MLADTLELREAHISALASRPGEERPRKPYPLMERLRYQGHMMLYRPTPLSLHRGQHCPKPDLLAEVLSGTVERRLLPATRTMAYPMAAWCQAGFTGG
jgi:hypothetical protein